MNSIEMVEAVIVMLRKQGFRCKDITAENGKVAIQGLEMLPPTPKEEADLALKMKSREEMYEENLHTLGLFNPKDQISE